MRTKIKFHHLLLIGALALGSCQKEYVQFAPKIQNPITPITPITDTVTFTTDVYPIITKAVYNCIVCHGGGIPPDLSSDAIAFTALTTGGFINISSPASSKFYISVTTLYAGPSGQMSANPGNPPFLSNAEQDTILAWITQGANH